MTSDGSEAWDILNKPEAPSLVISDWMMPNMNGVELCRKVREMDRPHYVYFIILTAKGQKADVIEALEAGADDFLIKPFDQEELKYRVKIGERIIRLEQRILDLASKDFLTGVLNRRAFMEKIEQEIHRAARANTHLSLILADIDGFKNINDEHGHTAGDAVLQSFTKTLSESLRRYDFIGRYGGEEFLVCLVGADDFQAERIAERMRKAVEEMSITLPETSQAIRITASFGVASRIMRCEASVISMTRRADNAMYKAKRKGKNQVCAANEEIRSHLESGDDGTSDSTRVTA